MYVRVTFFLLGAASAAVLTILSPQWDFNIQSMLRGGAQVAVERSCNFDNSACSYIRTEIGTGINDVSVSAVYSSRVSADRGGLAQRRIECDPGANVEYYWDASTMVISASDGACEYRGVGAFGLDVKLVMK